VLELAKQLGSVSQACLYDVPSSDGLPILAVER
jgi:hypothetical protein